MKTEDRLKLENILSKSLEGKIPSPEEIRFIANLNDVEALYELFSTANEIRRMNFGNKVFVYGFLYISTYCKNSCIFCPYNVNNKNAIRYRKTLDEILDYATKMKEEGINLVDITIGEDPYIYSSSDGFKYLLSAISSVVENVGLPVMCSPGAVPMEWIKKLKDAGATWLALYQETYNREIFEKTRVNQDFDYRLKVKKEAKKFGLLIEDGILLGIGETMDDCINAIYAMKELGANQVREMGYVPFENASIRAPPPLLYEMKVTALMRLVHQDKLIAASYDIDGLKSLQLRLMVGANVVTSLIPAGSKLVGVANPELGLEGSRSLKYVRPYLSEIGLEVATLKDYQKWIEEEKERSNERA